MSKRKNNVKRQKNTKIFFIILLPFVVAAAIEILVIGIFNNGYEKEPEQYDVEIAVDPIIVPSKEPIPSPSSQINREENSISRLIDSIGQYGDNNEAKSYTEEELLETLQNQKDLCAFTSLQTEEKKVYAEIERAIETLEPEIKLSTTDEKVIDKVLNCVLMDHPEIFYVDGYTYTEYSRGKTVEYYGLSVNYTMEKEEILSAIEKINIYTDTCLAGMPSGADDYTKIKYLYEYLIEHTEYVLNSEENQNICSVILYGQSVCQGYAKAMQYLLREAGVFSTVVYGTVYGNEPHAWNLVRSDGDYYYVDVTWGDSSFQGNDNSNQEIGVNYDYLCVTTDEICKSHEIKNIIELPECTAVKDNYYVREGLYFTEMDTKRLAEIFRGNNEKASISIKCADDAVYKTMYNYLLEEQKIFTLVKTDKIKYGTDADKLTMSFQIN